MGQLRNYEIRPIAIHPDVIQIAKAEAEGRGISLNALFRGAICKELGIPEPKVQKWRRRGKTTA